MRGKYWLTGAGYGALRCVWEEASFHFGASTTKGLWSGRPLLDLAEEKTMKKKQFNENTKAGFDWNDPENNIESAYFRFQTRYGFRLFPEKGESQD